MSNERELLEQALSKEQTAYGYAGKPKAWQEGFDKGFKEAWQARASTTMQDDVKCDICNGNDKDIPCAYTTEKPNGCLRAARLQDDVRKDAERYRWLRDNKFNHFHLTHNDNASNYETAEYEINNNPDWYQDDPKEEIEKMKSTNTIWSFQYYPDTPIGFYNFSGASLCNVIDRAIECDQAIDKARE